MNSRAYTLCIEGVRPAFMPQFLWQQASRMLTGMGAELADTALMLRYRDGDVAAFELLYGRHRGPLFRFLLRQTGNPQTAEDIFQEVWSRVIRNRESYQPTAKFTTYIYHIARNCAVDHYRSKEKQQIFVSVADAEVPEAVAATNDPHSAAEAAELRKSLLAGLQQLPDDQREAFLLHEESGFTLEEIGALTGVNRETAKSRLRYALAKLRKCIPAATVASVSDD